MKEGRGEGKGGGERKREEGRGEGKGGGERKREEGRGEGKGGGERRREGSHLLTYLCFGTITLLLHPVACLPECCQDHLSLFLCGHAHYRL